MENKENISSDFIEFFKSYFKGENFTEEIEFNLRFYVFLLQSYIEYIKIPNKELINAWENDIKSFLFKKYNFEKDGIFNVHADVKFLIKDIDDLIKKSKYKTMNKELSYKKNNMIKVQSDDNLKKRGSIKNFDIIGDNIKSDEEQDEFETDFEIIKIDMEEELMNSKNIINDLTINNEDDEYKGLKKNITMGNLKSHSPTISSKSTAISIYDELQKNINKNDLELKSTLTLNIKQTNKEINPNFLEEFETEGITIVYKKNVIAQMTYNVFLKKIVIGNFFDDHFEYTYNFIEQCFYFMKREIVFKKIINCYNHYTDLKVPFIQRKKLINFMNILVIKLYECFPKIDYQDKLLTIIKTFYNSLISELKSNSKKRNSSIREFFFGGMNAIKTSVENIKEKNKDIKEKKEEKNKLRQSFSFFFGNNKKTEENEGQKKNIIKENNEKENESNIEEEVINECEKILVLFKSEAPKEDLLAETESNLYIYKLKIKQQNSKKLEKKNSRNQGKKLIRCNTERTTLSVLDEKESKEIFKKTKPYFSCLNYDIKEIGEKLINVSKLALNKIKRKELYNGAFSKRSKKITSPNVLECINKFDKLISFIVEDILSYDYPKDRAQMIDKWAKIADYCRMRNDYNDTLAIYIALKKGSILGLNITWGIVKSGTQKIIRRLDEFCCFLGNYKNIRSSMKSLNKNAFYIPYLGLLLKDINFYEENYKYLVNGNLINFEKINIVQNCLDEFFHFQKTKDKNNIKLIEELNFFDNLEVQTEDYLNNLADKIEPVFTLNKNPKKVKRLTIIDKKYFSGHSDKNFNSQKRLSHA